MALEIRELIVRVNVTDTPQTQHQLSLIEKKHLIDDCAKQVLKELKGKRKR